MNDLRVQATTSMGLEHGTTSESYAPIQHEQLAIVYESITTQLELIGEIETILPRIVPYLDNQSGHIDVKITIEKLQIELAAPIVRGEVISWSWARIGRFLRETQVAISVVDSTYQLGTIISHILNRLFGGS